LNTEDGKGNGVWSTLVMEKGIFWYVGERVGLNKKECSKTKKMFGSIEIK